MPEDDIVEHASDTCNANNGEDDKDITPPSGRGTTTGGGDDKGDYSSYSSNDSRRGLSVHSQRSICKRKKIKKSKKGQIMVKHQNNSNRK